MFDLSQKVALITGASSGIGRAAAVALATQGAKVVVTARRLERLQELAKELVIKGKEALPLQLDITDASQVEMVLKKTVQSFGRLDILVNNAGVYELTPLATSEEAAWDKVIDTDLKAYFFMIQKAVVEMNKNKWGRIINIGSVAMGGQGFGAVGGAAYTASKGGLVGMTESLALELASQNILVNCIAPGLIDTEMTKGFMDNPELIKPLIERIPLKRAGKPEEIASMVVFLASEESSYTTGSTIVVDGGWLTS